MYDHHVRTVKRKNATTTSYRHWFRLSFFPSFPLFLPFPLLFPPWCRVTRPRPIIRIALCNNSCSPCNYYTSVFRYNLQGYMHHLFLVLTLFEKSVDPRSICSFICWIRFILTHTHTHTRLHLDVNYITNELYLSDGK